MKLSSVCVCLAIVLINSVHQVLGRDCSNVRDIINCNECIRCGAFWCRNPEKGAPRCTSEPSPSWCPDEQEHLKVIEYKNVSGTEISTSFIQTNALVGAKNMIPINYSSTSERKVYFTITNTTQNMNVSLESSTKCVKDKCTVTVEAVPGQEFCSLVGRPSEYVDVKMTVQDFTEEVQLKYHVPCACECNDRDEDSSKCNYKGDYSCGVCFCHDGWSGDRCEQKTCVNQRGDLQCTNPDRSEVECSGNGYCGPCETCECYKDGPGSQYYDKNNYCADLCLTINSKCDDCLRNPTYGEKCEACFYMNLFFLPCNGTDLDLKDDYDRPVWVRCNETLDNDNLVEYAAMKEGDEVTIVMLSTCETTAARIIGSVQITIPVIIGIIGFLLATASVAGYVIWKNRTPPLPLTDPQYQNIGAEDCTGENPLYKPPTSSFKNPTYGKW